VKTERDTLKNLVWSELQRNRATTHYNLLQLVFGYFWKKKWQKSAKLRNALFSRGLLIPWPWGQWITGRLGLVWGAVNKKLVPFRM